MVTQSGGGTKDEDAKHVLDEFGKQVYDEIVKNGGADAEKYKGDLKGDLNKANNSSGELAAFPVPCGLIKNEGENLIGDRGHPCKKDGTGKDVDRFSVKEQAEYDNKKMKCSNSEGACAPFRRLHLCNKNFPNMNSKDSSKAKHDLLLDVCLAANYEAESLIRDHPKYKLTYDDSQLCTVLARSFADIGDIVRGRDLYRRDKGEKKKLEENLKRIFGDIYEGLSKNGAQKHYQDDGTGNYYQLREDWWTANRGTIWEAMTCSKELDNFSYFHATCGESTSPSMARDKCRCDKDKGGNAIKGSGNVNIVPTYFDYVPQFLRWFEEWAEDFCRKKKIYVGIVKKYCRGDEGKGEVKYCSRNGFDCEKTKRAIGKLRYGNQCTKCFFACYPYVDWIENQRKQFLKQKEKYDEEMQKYTNGGGGSGNGRQRRAAPSNINYEGYESKFYKELQSNEYGSVGKFLEKLNEEKACTAVDDKKGGKIDFKTVNSASGASGTNVESQGTFYRSKYCQPCPICGVKRDDKEWKEKHNSNECKSINLYKPKPNKEGTPITILKSGEGRKEIEKKLEEFCNQTSGSSGGGSSGGGSSGGGSSGGGAGGSASGDKNCGSDSQKLCQKWTCYQFEELTKENKKNGDVEDDDGEYDGLVTNSGGLCILQNKNKNKGSERNPQEEPAEIQKTFYDFFYYWVAHMLKDSIYWRTKKLDKCLQNGNKKCGKKICNGDCDCFQRWITQKETEWKAIKEQFGKQDFGNRGRFLDGLLTADFVLEGVLQIEFLKGDSEEKSAQDNQNSLDSEEIQHLKQIKKILDDEKQKNQEAGADGSGTGSANGQKTIMDKLIEYEKGIATKCLQKCQETQPSPGGGGGAKTGEPPDGRSGASPGSPSPAATKDTVGDGEEDDDDDDDEDDEEEKEDKGDKGDVGENAEVDTADETKQGEDNTQVEVAPTATKEDEVKVCETVDKLFKDDNTLTNACSTKYVNGREKFPNWKCVTPSGSGSTATSGAEPPTSVPTTSRGSGATTGGKDGATGGSICIPPRRRRLYVKKLHDWASDETTEASVSQETSGGQKTPSGEKLRTAFIQSAAIETFFLWHRYKKQKEKEKPQEGGLPQLLPLLDGGRLSSEDEDPQNKLKSGTIPPDFLRLMFYTLGDYRDIVVRGVADDKNGGNNIILNASGTKEEKEKMKQLQAKITDILNNQSGNNKGTSGTQQQTEREKREKWWNDNVESIWNGMICALTYEDSGGKDKPPTQDPTVKSALWDDTNKKPKQNGTHNYTYEKVQLKEDNENGAMPHGPRTSETPSASGEKTTLDSFIKRPPYFRYLEEWGQNFCKERKKRLKQIYEDCKVGDDEYKCSGYGEDCKNNLREKYDTLPSLECPGCGRHCSFYKKWIKKKRTEFNKQSNVYEEQKKKCKKETESTKNNDGNGFCETLKTCTDAAKYLERLKNGPCKNNSEEDQKVNGYIKFDDISKDKTFGHENYCDPCSKFTVNCNRNDHCDNSNGNNCKDNKITAEKIGNGVDSTVLDMRVIDDSATGFGDLQDCTDANIFKSIRKDVWKCGKVCGYNVCKPKNVNGETVSEQEKNDVKHIITIRALVTHWVQNFLEDYNKIKHKISHCTKTDQGSTCQNKCQNKCKCVGEWIKLKQQEWEEIKKRFLNQYKMDSDEYYPVRSVLETFLVQIGAANANNDVKKLIKLSEFYKSCGCSAKTNSEHNKNEDAIDCMLNKLQQKAKNCPGKRSGKETNCDENTTPQPDEEEELLEEDEQNQVKAPNICPKVDKPTEAETEETCTPASPAPKEPTAADGEETENNFPEPPAPGPPPAPPPLAPSDESILQTTIPLGIALALGSIAFLFLKKKRKKKYKKKFIKKKKKKKKGEKYFKNNKNYNKNINFDKIKNAKYYQKEIKKNFIYKKNDYKKNLLEIK